MGINAEVWTQNRLINRISKDLDLEGETFYRPALLEEAINVAITDAEKLVVNEYSDYLLTYQDYDLTAGQTELVIPSDIYKFRIRGIHFKQSGFDTVALNVRDTYKLKKIPIEEVTDQQELDEYRYRLINGITNGKQIMLYPPIRDEDTGTAKIRVWYIRTFRRLFEDSDILDVPYYEYILNHVRRAVMIKEGHPMINEVSRDLAMNTQDILKDMKFLSDDEEDAILEPNYRSLSTYNDTIGDI